MTKPPTRIAYLTGTYPKASHTFILREAAGLRDHGFDITTFSIREPAAAEIIGPEEAEAQSKTFYVLSNAMRPTTLIGAHLKGLFRAPIRYLSTLAQAWRMRGPGARAALYQLFYFAEAVVLAQELNRRQIRHLHNHFSDSSCTVAMLASRLAQIPFSFMMHGPNEFVEAPRWRLDLKIAEAAFVTCISHFCRSQGMIYAAPEHWAKMHIVHCGIETERYEKNDITDRTGKTLVFVGRLVAVKGVPILLDTLARLKPEHPDLKLILIGDGPDSSWIEDRIRELELDETVQLTGYQSQTEVAEHLARADILVLPSFAEGVPVVLMEAMASGLPVITTRIAGIPELVHDGMNGFVVPPGDIEALRDRIGKLLKEPETGVRFGKAGREHVAREYNITSEAGWLAQILQHNLDGTPRPGLRPESID
ncbi:MAG: glycosyltransferase family 4 protein [Pseudomonadota bacterium]